MRIAFAGTPEFALPALHALHASAHEIVVVLSQPDRRAGRGRRLQAPPVKQAAIDAGLPVRQPQRLTRETLAPLADDIDLLVVVAYGQLLPPAVLDAPRHGAINVHASLLPRWRGAAPIARALLAGDGETGISIMQMTAGLDAGPVLAQARCAIRADDTAASLHDRLAQLGAATLIDVLADLPGHLARARPQDDARVTHAPKLERDEGRIDWTHSAAGLARAVRAFNPWPWAWTEFGEERLRIRKAHAVDAHTTASHGTIVAAGRNGIDVATGAGVLRLLEIQRPGRRPATAADLANSHDLVGRRLGQAGQ